MKRAQKWLFPIAAMTLAGTLVAGCGSSTSSTSTNSTSNDAANLSSSDKPVDGGTLTFSSPSDIVTLNPVFINDTASQDAANFIYSSLYDVDRNGNLVADDYSLADQPLKISDDGLTYTVHIRNNAKWSDGQPVTVDDVIWTLNTYKNPDVGSPAISNFDKVKDIKKVDDQTIEITMKSVYAPFAYALNMAVLPSHVLKDVAPKELQKNAFGVDPTKTVTDGPWKWVAWDQKQDLKFDVDPNYFGPKPHIQHIVYKIYADQNTEVQALLKGDVDIDEALPVTSLSAVQANKSVNVVSGAGPYYEYVSFNFKASNFPGNFDPFTGEKTRQALAYALDRQAMVDKILKGTGQLQNSPFLPGSWADPGDAATNYNYDPEKAKELLKEDGWTPGADGILQKDGHRFSFELLYNTGNSRREQVAAVIQQEMKDIGVEVKPKAMDFSSLISNNINPGKYQALLLGWQLTLDPDQTSIFSSKYFPPDGQNAGWYKNTEIDQLWDQGTSTTDQSKRQDVYKQIATKITQDLPYIFLYQYGTPAGYSSKLHWAKDDAPILTLPYGYMFHIQNWWLSGGSN